ncbi:hypothetical protein F5Y15DRAFT_277764 [Xylariaceae sp. FL0016]|nr:hypothetical protein F5Y15DRAFT_277764 [Xylariaceae sp. FL0016]
MVSTPAILACLLVSTTAHQLNWTLVRIEFEKVGHQVSIDGSLAPPSIDTSFSGPIDFGNYAINAPLNCNNDNTHEGCHLWFNGTFDPNRCADLCIERSRYNSGIPEFSDRQCRFFNGTYMIQKNGQDYAQYCSLYTQTWDACSATNAGQWRDGAEFTVYNSQGYYNASDPGPCQPPSAAATCTPSSPPAPTPVEGAASSKSPIISWLTLLGCSVLFIVT